MKTRIALIFLVTILFSCSSDIKEKREYYEDGNIHLKYFKIENSLLYKVEEYNNTGNLISVTFENKNSKLDSTGYYYEDNKLISTVNFVDGVQTGLAQWYYPNGNVEESVYLVKGIRYGEHKFFRIDGTLKQINYYKLFNGEPVFNGVKRYDEHGELMPDLSEFADLTLLKDTVKITDTLFYKLDIILSEDLLTRAILGDFNSNFEIDEQFGLKQVDINSLNYIFPTKVGKNTLRILFEFRKDIEEKDTIKTYIGKIYLEKDYVVLE